MRIRSKQLGLLLISLVVASLGESYAHGEYRRETAQSGQGREDPASLFNGLEEEVSTAKLGEDVMPHIAFLYILLT